MATYSGNSIVDYLKSSGQASDYASRAKLAAQNGITGYTGTAAQNLSLLSKLNTPTATPAPAQNAPVNGVQMKTMTVAPTPAAPTPTATRNAPTVATPTQPLVTKGGTAPNFNTPTAATATAPNLQDIAYKKLTNQALTEDENKFLINNAIGSYSPPVITPDYSMAKSGGYYRAAANDGALKEPLPSRYRTEEEYANADPEGYDAWANRNGHYYSTDGTNYYPQAPDQLHFSVDDYMNATPEEQMQMRAQAFRGMSQQHTQLLNDMFDKLIGQNQSQYDQAKTDMEAQNKTALDQFTANQEASARAAEDQIRRQGDVTTQNIKDVQSFSGFGRSTKTEELLANASSDTQARIADIERQKGQAISEYQATLLDKMQTRLDRIQQAGDNLKTLKAQKSLDLATELMKQDPSNPEVMIKNAEELQKNRIEQEKLNLQERNQIHDDALANFKFMVDTYGSKFTQNMSDDDVANLAANTGMSPDMLRNLGATMSEQKDQWDQMKYVQDKQWDAYKFDQSQKFDIQKMLFGKKLDTAKYANVGYGDYQAGASGSTGSSFVYDTPIAHPANGQPVIELNPKIAQAYPDGYRFTTAGNSLAGQCAWFVEQLTNLNGKSFTVGDTLAQKKAALANYAKQGLAFYPGQEEPKVGYSIISNDSKQFGHFSTINAITADGKYVLSEANRAAPLTVTNTRTIAPNDPSIIGFIKTQPKDKYSVGEVVGKTLGALGSAAKSGAFGGLGSLLANLPEAIGKSVQNSVEGTSAAQKAAQDAKTKELIAQGVLDENGNQLSPERQQVRSGRLPDVVLTKMYNDLSTAYQNTGDPRIQSAMTQFLSDYAVSQKNASKIKASESPISSTQAQAAGYAASMQQAEDVIKDLGGQKVNLAGLNDWLARAGSDNEFVYDKLNQIREPNAQRLVQAEAQFIANILRKESGAAITFQEYKQYGPQYFPRPGDTAQVVDQKAKARAQKVQNILFESGPQGQQYFKNSGYALPSIFGGGGGQDQYDAFGNSLMSN